MRQNVVILTSGLTGSSVLAGLISRAGYWTGESTHKKKDYDTYENEELIQLNLRIFREAGFSGDYLTQFSSEGIAQIESFCDKSGEAVYRAFIDQCNRHQPWIWKDPRLWMTIHFWKKVLDLKDCKFIVLERNFRQMWVSTMLRRQIVTYRRSKEYEQHVKDSAVEFLDKNHLTYLMLRYEDLIVRPSETIGRLNNYLQTNLTVEDLRATYQKPLYKNPVSSTHDFYEGGSDLFEELLRSRRCRS